MEVQTYFFPPPPHPFLLFSLTSLFTKTFSSPTGGGRTKLMGWTQSLSEPCHPSDWGPFASQSRKEALVCPFYCPPHLWVRKAAPSPLLDSLASTDSALFLLLTRVGRLVRLAPGPRGPENRKAHFSLRPNLCPLAIFSVPLGYWPLFCMHIQLVRTQEGRRWMMIIPESQSSWKNGIKLITKK